MSPVEGFCGGLAAGSAFLVVELSARIIASVPTLPELVQDRLVQQLPGPAFSFLLTRLLYLGKPLLFAALLLLQLLLGGFVGVLIARWRRPMLLGSLCWLATGVVLLPLAGSPIFDRSVDVALSELLAFAVFVFALEAFWRPAWRTRPARAPARGKDIARRELLGGGALFLAAIVLARRAIGRLPVLPRQNGLPAAVTSPGDFYLVSKNILDPKVDVANWQLRVDGLVDRPLTLTFNDVLALTPHHVTRTLECISNEVGGPLISNGDWTGVLLGDVLTRAGVQPQAASAHFTSVDGYTESMPIGQAMAADTLLVYQLDGQPLPSKHGFPLRVLGAGTYGMKNPKWLQRIELVGSGASGFGFWEQQGWSQTAVVRTMSRIDVPGGGLVAAGDVTFAGIAFAGDRGVERVELSVDGGQSWRTADLVAGFGQLSWVVWQLTVALGPGIHEVLVRATDGAGTIQTSHRSDPYPDGATGYDRLQLGAEL